MAKTNAFLSVTIAIVESTDGGFLAYVKELPGCIAQGETPDEAQENLIDTAEAYFETLIERAESHELPPPEGRVLREETYKIKPELVPA